MSARHPQREHDNQQSQKGDTTVHSSKPKPKQQTENIQQPKIVPHGCSPDKISSIALLYMGLLALQFGIQPFVTKWFTSPKASKPSLVIVCELCKFWLATLVLLSTSSGRSAIRTWSMKASIAAAGIPAVVYAIQNVCLQVAYQNLGATTFQLINQTKIIWTALFAYVILRRRQSKLQCVAMLILVFSAVLITTGDANDAILSANPNRLYLGLIPGLLAALLSGLASAMSQWSLQGQDRNTYLFSAELATYTTLVLVVRELLNGQGMASFFDGWTWATMIPVLVNATGGLIVGLVTKYAGSIAKGYAIVVGILFTGFVEAAFIDSAGFPWRLWVALPLVIASTTMHTKYPYVPPGKKTN